MKTIKKFSLILVLCLTSFSQTISESYGEQNSNLNKNWKVLCLDIDASVVEQSNLAKYIDDTKNLRHIENSTRLWANKKALSVVRSTIAEFRKKYPEKWLTFNGSGDLHMLAALLIESLPDKFKPITLVMFDNHPDWFKVPAKYHCGAWVAQVLRETFVEKVVLIGQNSLDIRGEQFLFSPFHELCTGRVELYPYMRKESLVPLRWQRSVAGVAQSKLRLFGTQLNFQTVKDTGFRALANNLAEKLQNKNVYISIDKDVLDSKFASTDWDQGMMSLEELTSMIKIIAAKTNLVGIDICGERAPLKIRGLAKIIDSGREFRKEDSKSNWSSTNKLNEQTNLDIIEKLKSAFN